MKRFVLFTLVFWVSLSSMSGVTYVYKELDGRIIIMNKKTTDSTRKLVDAHLTGNENVFNRKPQLEFERQYKDWVKLGKPKPALLIPERVSKEIGFTGYVIFSLYEGKGLISRIPYNTDYTYNTYDDCISEGDSHLVDFKKSSKNKLNPNYVYPKGVRKEYSYRCLAEVVSITRQIFNTTTLKKWEKEAIFERNKEEELLKKDYKSLEEARKEIDLNKIYFEKNYPSSIFNKDDEENKISNSKEFDEKSIQLSDERGAALLELLKKGTFISEK